MLLLTWPYLVLWFQRPQNQAELSTRPPQQSDSAPHTSLPAHVTQRCVFVTYDCTEQCIRDLMLIRDANLKCQPCKCLSSSFHTSLRQRGCLRGTQHLIVVGQACTTNRWAPDSPSSLTVPQACTHHSPTLFPFCPSGPLCSLCPRVSVYAIFSA